MAAKEIFCTGNFAKFFAKFLILCFAKFSSKNFATLRKQKFRENFAATLCLRAVRGVGGPV